MSESGRELRQSDPAGDEDIGQARGTYTGFDRYDEANSTKMI